MVEKEVSYEFEGIDVYSCKMTRAQQHILSITQVLICHAVEKPNGIVTNMLLGIESILF